MRLIEVKIRENEIAIFGHAGYAEPGKDIVCAGVTALTETLVKSLEDLTEDVIEYEISPGWVDIQFGNLSGQGQLLVDSFFLGLCLIAADFPDHIKIL